MECSFTTTKGCARNTPSWVARTACQGHGLYIGVSAHSVGIPWKCGLASDKEWQVVLQNPDRRATPRPEDKKVAGERIGIQLLLAYRLDCDQNPYLRRDLNHPSVSRQARNKLAQSRAVDAFHWTGILFPLGASNSITHSSCGAISSTNAGLVALRRRMATPPIRFFKPT
jgi:hypothetical protein